MARYVDLHLEDVPIGSLVFPSSSARTSGNGGYMLEDGYPRHHIKNDSEIFPAIVLDPRKGTLVTPTGLKSIGRYSLVSVMK